MIDQTIIDAAIQQIMRKEIPEAARAELSLCGIYVRVNYQVSERTWSLSKGLHRIVTRKFHMNDAEWHREILRFMKQYEDAEYGPDLRD